MQKTAYEMRISDWSSDVCSSDLFYRGPVIGLEAREGGIGRTAERPEQRDEREQRRNTDEPTLALRQSCPPVSYPFAHGTARTVILAICCMSVPAIGCAVKRSPRACSARARKSVVVGKRV